MFKSQLANIFGSRQPQGITFHGDKSRYYDRIFVQRKDPLVLKNFVWFCTNECTIENVLAAIAIGSYGLQPTLDKAEYIYQKFVPLNSEFPLNFTEKLRFELQAALRFLRITGQRARSPRMFTPPTFFDDLESEVEVCLIDQWERFYYATKSGSTGDSTTFSVASVNQKFLTEFRNQIAEMRRAGFMLSQDIFSI